MMTEKFLDIDEQRKVFGLVANGFGVHKRGEMDAVSLFCGRPNTYDVVQTIGVFNTRNVSPIGDIASAASDI